MLNENHPKNSRACLPSVNRQLFHIGSWNSKHSFSCLTSSQALLHIGGWNSKHFWLCCLPWPERWEFKPLDNCHAARGAEHMTVRKRGGEHNVLFCCVLMLMGKTCSLHEPRKVDVFWVGPIARARPIPHITFWPRQQHVTARGDNMLQPAATTLQPKF